MVTTFQPDTPLFFNLLKHQIQLQFPACGVLNPIDTVTGNKLQVETDYQDNGAFPLGLTRYYNSNKTVQNTSWGERWRTDYDRRILLSITTLVSTAYAYRPDGKVFFFNLNGTQWVPDADVNDQLVQLTDTGGNPTGWQYTTADDTIETCDVTGKLLTVTNRASLTWTLNYDVDSTSGGDDDPGTTGQLALLLVSQRNRSTMLRI